MKEKSLLSRAVKCGELRKSRGDNEEVQILSLAWAEGKVSLKQAAFAMTGRRMQRQVAINKFAYAFRAMVQNGKLIVARKEKKR